MTQGWGQAKEKWCSQGIDTQGPRGTRLTAVVHGSVPRLLTVVFAGSVRSGLLTLRDMDRDLDRSTVTIKGKKTGLNRPRPQFSVHGPVLTSLGLNRFKTGSDRFFWQLCIGRFINITLSFNLSLRTLIYVKNWCSYENISVHLLFLSFFSSILRFWQYLCQILSK
jgi:hypothetical protein